MYSMEIIKYFGNLERVCLTSSKNKITPFNETELFTRNNYDAKWIAHIEKLAN